MFYIDKIEQVIFALIVVYIISIIYNDSRIMGITAIFALIVPELDQAIHDTGSLLLSITLMAVILLSIEY
jgi:exosortase/archaeosortase family protein